MVRIVKRIIKWIFNIFGLDIFKRRKNFSSKEVFLSYHYQRLNNRRLEHLASLGLKIPGATVLELGAGIGDHTSFFIDRGCEVVCIDTREENLEILRTRYSNNRVLNLNLDGPCAGFNEVFDIVYCYGLLYHLKNPDNAIEFMSRSCRKMLLLESCVSYSEKSMLANCNENKLDPSQSISGQGCRPSREWVHNKLKQYFEFVYMPVTQPWHEEFPVDWESPFTPRGLTRAIFIASREKLNSEILVQGIPLKQIRY